MTWFLVCVIGFIAIVWPWALFMGMAFAAPLVYGAAVIALIVVVITAYKDGVGEDIARWWHRRRGH